MQYLEIPFATLFGWVFFADFPNGLALAGILITVAAGLYIVFRERTRAEPVPPET
jgi:drug/metabolite transporter (DMT)-like permease